MDLRGFDRQYLGGLVALVTRPVRRMIFNVDRPVAKVDSMLVQYRPSGQNLLAQLCDLYGSDKGTLSATGHPYPWPAHSYADFYNMLFAHCRFAVRSVFECGIGSIREDLPANMGNRGKPGASLRVWRDYFPEATVVGADIDESILFEEDRIRTHHVDQADPASIRAMWAQEPIREFDLMVDDGWHVFNAGRTLFENSFHLLRPGGLWIIEDVGEADLKKYMEYFDARDLDVGFVCLERKGLRLGDNCMVIIRADGVKREG